MDANGYEIIKEAVEKFNGYVSPVPKKNEDLRYLTIGIDNLHGTFQPEHVLNALHSAGLMRKRRDSISAQLVRHNWPVLEVVPCPGDETITFEDLKAQ